MTPPPKPIATVARTVANPPKYEDAWNGMRRFRFFPLRNELPIYFVPLRRTFC
jgi:hypothetical protein